MVDISYTKGIIPIRHIWFCEDAVIDGAALTYCHALNEDNISQKYKAIRNKQFSLITDLTQEMDTIYRGFRKNIRYEIRRCGREDIRFLLYTSSEMQNQPELLKIFKNVYETMYKEKGMHVKFNCKLVQKYMEQENIIFTIAFYKNSPLVFHSYIVDKTNARFYYSASPFRTQATDADLIARMNKGLHWFDLQTLKNKGFLYYDWGGISNPHFPNGIDNFKLGFESNIVEYYNVIYLKGFWGYLYYWLKKRNT